MADLQWSDSIMIGSTHSKEQLISGSVGFNNPVKKALEEAERVFGSERRVSVVISLGSRSRRAHSITNRNKEGFQEAVLSMTMDGDSVAEDLAQRFLNSSFYYRLSVESETKPGNTTEWDNSTIDAITTHTRTYTERNSSRLAAIAEILAENQGHYTIGQLSKYPISNEI